MGVIAEGRCVIPCERLDVCNRPGTDAATDAPPSDATDASDAPTDITIPCATGQHACGTTCVDDNAPATCGTRCTPCPAAPGSSATCTAGTCGFTCTTGWELRGTRCEPLAPRPIGPLSTSTVTSHQPTLRWTLPEGVDGAVVEICRDRACTTVEQRIEATGTSARPTAALTRGVWFWRLRGLSGGVTGTQTSPVWQFWTRARSTPVDTSWGTTLDVNGDGYADLAVSAPDRFEIYHGATTGIGTSPASTVTSPVGPNVGFGAPRELGDINGDGFCDIGIFTRTNPGGGMLHVFLGSSAGISPLPSGSIRTSEPTAVSFAIRPQALGDIDGDGYSDVIVDMLASDAPNRFELFHGSATGLRSSPTQVIPFPATDGSMGQLIAAGSDLNGDGRPDFVVGSACSSLPPLPGIECGPGRLFVYLGTRADSPMSPSLVIEAPSPAPWFFGTAFTSQPDVNGDGYADIIVSGNNVAYAFLGGPGGPASMPTSTMPAPVNDTRFGLNLSGIGDLDADGYDDIVIAAELAEMNSGRVYVYRGGVRSGVSTMPNATLAAGEGPGSVFGRGVAGGGDIDRDGFDDFAVGAPCARWDSALDACGVGMIFVFNGASLRFPARPPTVISGRYGDGSQFGSWFIQ